MTALTHAERFDRAMTEADLQRLVTDMATVLGWSWVHFRPAQTKHGWRTPVEGPLGAGWPDLVLLRVRDRRLIFAELKREKGQVSADQAAVLAGLVELCGTIGDFRAADGCSSYARVEVWVWKPSDLTEGRIQAVLT
jgi:hypothetical protein